MFRIGLSLALLSLFLISCGDDRPTYWAKFESSSSTYAYCDEEDEDCEELCDKFYEDCDEESSSSKSKSSSSSSNDNKKDESKEDSVYDENSDYTYKTVQIGYKVWFAENLRKKSSNSMCFDNSSLNCTIYGRLYKTPTPVCPSGFDVPTKEDWEELFTLAKTTAALKAKALWKDSKKSKTPTNDLHFALLPAGTCTKDSCHSQKENTNLLIADSDGYYTISYDSDSVVYHENYDSKLYYSVRCVKLATHVLVESDLPVNCTKNSVMTVGNDREFICKNGNWFEQFDVAPKHCDTKNELREAYYDGDKYVCRSGKWRVKTDIEETIGFCDSTNTGDTIRYSGDLYTCSNMEWHNSTLEDVYGKCTSTNAKKIVTFNGTKYACKSDWTEVTSLEEKLGICYNTTAKLDTTTYSSTLYICDGEDWRKASLEETFGSCSSANAKKIVTYSGTKYTCKNKWTTVSSIEEKIGICYNTTAKLDTATYSGTLYACDTLQWRAATLEDLYGPCKLDESKTVFKLNGREYSCMDSTYNVLTTQEKSLGLCTSDIYGTIKSGYICKNHSWSTPTMEDIIGECTSAVEYDTATYNSVLYACKNDAWTKATAFEITNGVCGPKTKGKITSDGYVCDNNTWRSATAEEVYGECTEALQDTVMGSEICDEGTWREKTSVETTLKKICTKTNEGDKATSGTTYYMCENGSWNSVTKEYYSLGICNASNEGRIAQANTKQYMCMSGKWTAPTPTTLSIYEPCSTEDSVVYKNDTFYQCTRKSWRSVSTLEMAFGLCHLNDTRIAEWYKDTAYTCKNDSYNDHYWSKSSLAEILGQESCGTTTVYGQKYSCTSGSWAPVYRSFTDSRDNQTYRTLLVNGVTWMADGLKYETPNSTCYNNNTDLCNKYGRMYTWDDAQDACPTGWHLPSFNEYETLYSNFQEINLLAQGSWQGQSTDSDFIPGFEMKAGGYKSPTGSFEFENRGTGIWCSNEHDGNGASAYLQPQNAGIQINELNKNSVFYTKSASTRDVIYADKDFGLYVRCIKD